MNKKTIFLTVSNRRQARNVLRTDIFKVLNSNSEIKIIVFVPSLKLDEYKKEFSNFNQADFVGIHEAFIEKSFLDSFFRRLSRFYVNTQTVRLFTKIWLLWERKKKFRYLLSRFFLFWFGSIKLNREISRFLDLNFVRQDYLAGFFDKYKPDLVLVSNVISEIDSFFIKQAKLKKILSVGIVDSWDNIVVPKQPFRFLPDKLVVHNEVLQQEAVEYLSMKKENVFVAGMPHFDHYVNSQRNSREEFCKKFDINPARKIILFFSNSCLNPTEWQSVYSIDQAILKKQIADDTVVIVRHHPVKDMIRGDVEYSKNVIFDNSKTVFKEHGEVYTEILKKDMNHLADSLFHADVVISTRSTVSIDASAFDTPIIDLVFDGRDKKPYYKSVAILYSKDCLHYLPIIKSGGVKLAHSFKELISFINMYLKNPDLDSEGRKRIVKEQCWKLDGKSGERIAKFVMSLVWQKT